MKYKINKKSLLILPVLTAFTAISVHAQSTNFSGSWKRNDEKTKPGDLSINTVPAALDITQNEKAIYLKATLRNKAGETHYQLDTLNTDGSAPIIATSPKTKKQSSLKWSADKKQFIETLLIIENNGSVIQTWKQTYDLKDEGKTLQVALDLEFNGESYHLDEAFDKQ